jgi:NAD(P)-dependent dehydrogenase (short-subunit alcohol dehydrogenase family)
VVLKIKLQFPYVSGVQVIVACRNSAKTEAAVHELRLTECEDGKAAAVEQVELNLASLSSVERCAKHVINKGLPINLLINNAGTQRWPSAETNILGECVGFKRVTRAQTRNWNLICLTFYQTKSRH